MPATGATTPVAPGCPESDMDSAALIEAELEAWAQTNAAEHARLLQLTLALQAASGPAGAFTDITLAFCLRISERRAERLLREATRVAALAASFAIYDTLTPEQVDALLKETDGLSPAHADAVVDAVLAAGPQVGPRPVTLTARQTRAALDLTAETKRRETAAKNRGISHIPLSDGQAGLWIHGPAHDITRLMAAIAQRAGDDRFRDPDISHDAHRFDTLLDLVLDRATPCPTHNPGPGDVREASSGGTDGSGATTDPALPLTPACQPGKVSIIVLAPLASLLDHADTPGYLLGHGPGTSNLTGPADAAWIREQLHQAPLVSRQGVHPVTGTPVGEPDPPIPLSRDPQDIRDTLLAMTDPPPPQLQHRQDQPDPTGAPPTPHGTSRPAPTSAPTAAAAAEPAAACPHTGPDIAANASRNYDPGPYRPPAALRRYVQRRSITCEFPGCTVPATRCDLDHDLAWPQGPTCQCNLGPLCRHHHRLKQTGWTKTRTEINGLPVVTWTSPTGRQITRHSTYPAVPTATDLRPLTAVTDGWDDQLDDPQPWDPDPDDHDAYLERQLHLIDPWTLPDPEDPDPDHRQHLLDDPWRDHTWEHLDDPHLDLPPITLGDGEGDGDGEAPEHHEDETAA
ncbi:MAG: hypothetical protein Q8R60_12045 [Mycobacteriales bacterium]|nr:hypothetical protein [Mycobacteriales bacterium]